MADSGKFGDDIQRHSGTLRGDWYAPVDHDLITKCNSWLIESIRHFIKRVERTDPTQLVKFTIDVKPSGTTTSDSTGSYYDVFGNNSDVTGANYGKVLRVYRKDHNNSKKYMAREVDRMQEAYLGDTNSIYYATIQSPAWFRAGQSIHVYPKSTTSQDVGFIQVYYDTTVTTNSSDIDYFPDEYYIFPILHTASQVINYKLSAMRDRLPDAPNYDGYGLPATTATETTGVNDNVTQASTVAGYSQTATQATAYNEGWNAVRWYIESEEDVELASAKMQELTAEQQLFVTDYQWLQGQLQLTQQEFEQRFAAAFGVVGGQ